MRPRLAGHIGEWGTVESGTAYRQLLRQSHVVLSTALHEFQGLAVLEAAASGCVPLVPDRLAYPEFIPDDCRYPSFPEDSARECEEIAMRLAGLEQDFRNGRLPGPPNLSRLSWSQLKTTCEKEIMALL
jgi:glycosyltransferase involved in cell wall biosynthesis